MCFWQSYFNGPYDRAPASVGECIVRLIHVRYSHPYCDLRKDTGVIAFILSLVLGVLPSFKSRDSGTLGL